MVMGMMCSGDGPLFYAGEAGSQEGFLRGVEPWAGLWNVTSVLQGWQVL